MAGSNRTERSARPISNQEQLPRLSPRPAESHKGDFGLVLVVGGSTGMAGAVGLAGMTALRGGAGLVRLAVPDACLETVAAFEPSAMTLALPSDRKGRIALDARPRILKAAAKATVVACGPGLGRSLGLNALVAYLYRNLDKPMVVDADGLNALASRPEVLANPGGPRILTPHPGEFARLTGSGRILPENSENGERETAAVELARRSAAVVVLKGHRTCITDGHTLAINTTGNPGMATGGSGDVLTGLVAALWCQGLGPLDAARLAVHLHGLAGDLAVRQLPPECLVATDLIRHLPEAFATDRS